MPLDDGFKLIPMTIDFVDGARSVVGLTMDPDDIRGRGIDVTFTSVRETVDMTGDTVWLYWQHDQAPALRGITPFESVEEALGHFKVHWPNDMGRSPGTVTAKISIGEGPLAELTDENRYSDESYESVVNIRLPEITVPGGKADPSATTTTDNFSILGDIIVAFRTGYEEIERKIVVIDDVVERGEEAVQNAELAVNRANAATRETLDNEAERQSKFEESQTANQRTFDDALAKMQSDHDEEERAHREAFDTAQTQRQDTFEEDERTRQATFDSGEQTRQQTFEDAEADRGREHDEAQESRQQAFDTAEAKRQEDHEAEEAAHRRAFEEAETARDAAVDEAVSEADAAAERADSSARNADTSAAGADSSAQIAYKAAQDADAAREELQGLEADVEAAEADRVTAERARVEKQAANDAQQAKNNADQAANNLAAQGVIEVWLEDPSQYDETTRQPTVEAENGKRYNTPAPNPEEGNRWLEWKPRFKPDGSYEWELIGGSGSRPPDPMTTDQVDRIVAGEDVEGTQTLNATIASYYEKARRAKDATLYDAKGAAEAARQAAVDASEQDLADAIKDQAGTDAAQDEAMVEAMTAIGKAQADATAGLADAKSAQDAADAAQKAADDAKSAADDVGGKLSSHVTEQETRDSDQDDAIEKAQTAADDAARALTTFKTEQGKTDSTQDEAIRAAKETADAAAKAIPSTVTAESGGTVPAYPGEGRAYLCVDQGELGWKALPVVTKTDPGVVPPLPADASEKKLYAMGADENGQGKWYEVKASSGGAADPRELRALIASATKMHDEAWTGTQSDPLLHSWKNTSEAIAALQVAIDAAKVVSDGFGTDYFLQSELDDARDALEAAIETFKSTGTEVMPDLVKFESLKARVKAVDDSTVESADGKDVPFGSKYVLTSERNTAKGAVDTCQSSIDAATKQSQIDSACTTLETAVTAYEGQVKTAAADTSALDKAIEDANTARDGVQVSEDGSDLPAGSRYVTDQATLDAIEEAVQTATAAKTSSTTQAQLDAATSELTQATEDFNKLVKQNVSIYGVKFPGFPSNVKGTRTDAAEHFDDPVPALNGTGGSSPFDVCYPWSEMQVVDRAGGKMVRIPKFYIKYGESGSNGLDTFQIATGPVEGFEVAPAFADRHDGKGERDEVFVGAYHCATGTYKSTSGVRPQVSVTRANMRNNVKTIGDGYCLMDLATQQTIDMLYLVEFANWNSQMMIGYGCGTGSSAENNGASDTIQYHTGTVRATRQTYGTGIKYRGIENLWANVYTVIDGCYYNGNGMNIILNPEQFSENSNGQLVGPITAGYTSKLAAKKVDGVTIFYPTAANGSATTGTCDSWYFNASYPVLYVGGYWYQDENLGLFFVVQNGSGSGTDLGFRLLELP